MKMNWLTILVICTVLMNLCWAQNDQSPAPNFERNYANQLIDTLLNSFKTTYAHKLDPITFPNVSESFEKTILGVHFEGQFELFNGKIQGLSRIYRIEDAFLGQNSDTGELAASVRLGINNTKITAGIAFKLNTPKMNKTGSLLVSVGHIDITADGFLNMLTMKPDLQRLKLNQLSDLVVYFNGLGFVGDTLNGLSMIVLNYFNKYVKGIVQAQLTTGIQKAFA